MIYDGWSLSLTLSWINYWSESKLYAFHHSAVSIQRNSHQIIKNWKENLDQRTLFMTDMWLISVQMTTFKMESTLQLNTKSFHCNKTNSHTKPQSTITWLVEIWWKFSGNCSCNITFLASSLSSLIRSISFSSCMCGSVQSRKQFICRGVFYQLHLACENKGPQLPYTILYSALLGQLVVSNCKSAKYFRIKSLFLSALQSCSSLDHN